MIDRHRTLIHILLSGLVGLTFGLSIGWWVWPVEWTEGPTGQPVATAPIQAGESPVEGGAENAAEFTSFQDRLNQGLLFLAAALLLVGGVVIGYQLLRQSQKAEGLQRSTTVRGHKGGGCATRPARPPSLFPRRKEQQTAARSQLDSRRPPRIRRSGRRRACLSSPIGRRERTRCAVSCCRRDGERRFPAAEPRH